MSLSWDQQELVKLIWHWGDCYLVTFDKDRWHAVRRDNQGELDAGSAEQLRDMIRDDYAALPVNRKESPPDPL